MKLRVLISIFFIIATTATAIHELEHINGHDSSSCQVCIVDNHSVSSDIVDKFIDVEQLRFEEITLGILIYNFYKKTHTNQNRAPPLKS
ncbi:hypothetical protein [Sulfurimonas sp. CS5]|jgi:hypothetical protein|uniref:hypothetical protein n=1 Tax=Sulfurimonas sp. CS5 TaxID=3391145 RepID=UPI0039EA2503